MWKTQFIYANVKLICTILGFTYIKLKLGTQHSKLKIWNLNSTTDWYN